MRTRSWLISFPLLLAAHMALAAGIKQLVDIEVPKAQHQDGWWDWRRDGTVVLWSGRSNDVTVSVYPAGKPSWSVVLPETAGADRTQILRSPDLKYIVAQVQKGQTHSFHSFKLTPKQLKPKGDYTMDQPAGADLPQAECVDSTVFIAQQLATSGLATVRILTRSLKEKVSEDMNLCADGCGAPDAEISPHGSYVVARKSFDPATLMNDSDIYAVKGKRLRNVGSVMHKGQTRWLICRRDRLLRYAVPNAVNHDVIDSVPSLQRLVDIPVGTYENLAADASGKSVVVVYTNKTLSVFSRKGELGPYQLTDSALTDRVAIVYFRKLMVVLAFYHSMGPYVVRGYRITRQGLKAVAGPVTGMRLDAGSCGAGGKYILVNDYEQVSGAEEGINTNPGPYYRFYTRKLKYVDGVTCGVYSYVKERTLLDIDQGLSTSRIRVWSW